jgi:hypothetical protein
MTTPNIAIGTYLRLTDKNGVAIPGNAWQNFHHGEARTREGIEYLYAGFGFTGAALDIEAASVTAQLVFSLNTLDLSVFQAACDNSSVAHIDTVWLDPESLTETATYYSEVMSVLSFSHNSSRLTVTVGSPDNALDVGFPRLRLSSKMVGQLPSQGQIPLT